MNDADENHIRYYDTKLKNWNLQAQTLRGAQVSLAFISITCSVLAASELVGDCPALSAIAAVAVALFAGLSVSQQANKLRAAWRALNCAVRAYREDENANIETVRKAYQQAETIIGAYEPKSNG